MGKKNGKKPYEVELKNPEGKEINTIGIYCDDPDDVEFFETFFKHVLKIRYIPFTMPGIIFGLSAEKGNENIWERINFMIKKRKIIKVILIEHKCKWAAEKKASTTPTNRLIIVEKRLKKDNQNLIVEGFFAERKDHKTTFNPVNLDNSHNN